jgi:hypothetical protein
MTRPYLEQSNREVQGDWKKRDGDALTPKVLFLSGTGRVELGSGAYAVDDI